MRKLQKRLRSRTTRNIILTIALVDCLGIYAANRHLSKPAVEDEGSIQPVLAGSSGPREGQFGEPGLAVAANPDAAPSWLPAPAFGHPADMAVHAAAIPENTTERMPVATRVTAYVPANSAGSLEGEVGASPKASVKTAKARMVAALRPERRESVRSAFADLPSDLPPLAYASAPDLVDTQPGDQPGAELPGLDSASDLPWPTAAAADLPEPSTDPLAGPSPATEPMVSTSVAQPVASAPERQAGHRSEGSSGSTAWASVSS